MKLGFYADYSPNTVKFAEEVGFRCMELSAWPESSLNAEKVSEKEIGNVLKDMEKRNLEISALREIRERSVPIWSNREQHGYTRVSLERYRISRHPRMTGTNAEQAGAIGKGQEKSRIVWKR